VPLIARGTPLGVLALLARAGRSSATRACRRSSSTTCSTSRASPAVANLVTNAVKFTPPGGSIDVGLAIVGERAVLRVADSSRGIDPALLPHVFDRFRHGSDARASGLGIGLTIVRAIIDLHGGDVRADSEGPGLGTTLTVSLPRLAG
jgi:two-component system CheB/CheR fusion protein